MFRAKPFFGISSSVIWLDLEKASSESDSSLEDGLAGSTVAKERNLISKYPEANEVELVASGDDAVDDTWTEKYRGRHISKR